jgi:diguanylate cyclase (GGDEF)-like protein
MRARLHVRTALLALVPVLLLAGWVYLWASSHAVDTERHNGTHTLLMDLKQIDSDWSADVLRAHAGLDTNYDALAAPLERFADGLARLRDRTAPLREPALDVAVARLEKAVDAKAILVDEFKSENSLFENSLRYVPTAHRELQALLAGGRGAPGPLEAGLTFLVNESLRYSAVPDEATASRIRAGIARMRDRSATVPVAWREPVANLLSHLDTLVRLRPHRREVLLAISKVPVAADIDALSAAFTQRVDAELAGQYRAQRLLLAYSAISLLLVFGGTGFIAYRNATDRHRLRRLVDEKTRELKDLATRDDLTRVHNRRHMGELLGQLLALHARTGAPLCIALLDIDRFKSINDRLGHAAGDAVLVRFATLVGHALRTTDLLGRWGGEEFLVALPDTSSDDAGHLLQRVRQALSESDFADVAAGLRITFSAGLVQVAGAESMSAAIERADRAMYRAKAVGRDRTEKG